MGWWSSNFVCEFNGLALKTGGHLLSFPIFKKKKEQATFSFENLFPAGGENFTMSSCSGRGLGKW
ncbi:MAG: hypothetical protein PWP57_511 [Candidatus Atribacteria bacterium]|nr:hypothetical protein [Candidatus Atribacteria bacterium]